MTKGFNQRPYHAFLSHSSKDKSEFVDKLHLWLEKKAGLRVWYDRSLQAGQIATNLDRAIGDCRSAIFVLSNNSVRSEWVNLEYNRIQEEATRQRDFRIVSVRLEDCEAPGFLRSAKHIDVGAGFSAAAGALLMESLFGGGDPSDGRPVYVSRGWHEKDADANEAVCRAAKTFGLRLVCDWPDQPNNDDARIEALMDSCGGLLAILPDRGAGATSRFVIKEIELARQKDMPVLVFAGHTIAVDEKWPFDVVRLPVEARTLPDWVLENCANCFEDLALNWRPPAGGQHVFIGHSLEESVDEMFLTARRMVSRLAGLPVVAGGLVSGADAQGDIVRLIQNAEFCLIDITNKVYEDLPDKINFALNSSIEAGIALGANRRLYLTCAGQRRSPPFMFRNKQIWFYESEIDLVGILRQVCALHRRLVW